MLPASQHRNPVVHFDIQNFQTADNFFSSILGISPTGTFSIKFKNYFFPCKVQRIIKYDQRVISIDVLSSKCLTCSVYTQSNQFWISWLGSGTFECQEVLRDLNITEKLNVKDLVSIAETIAHSLGFDHIYLQDDARIHDIHFSIYTFFTTGQTFYERYGFQVCNPDTNIKFRTALTMIGNMNVIDAVQEYEHVAQEFVTVMELVLNNHVLYNFDENWTIRQLYISFFDTLNHTHDDTLRARYLQYAKPLNEFILNVLEEETFIDMSEVDYCKYI